jgi:hypothetical protein
MNTTENNSGSILSSNPLNNLEQKENINNLFISAILLICCGALDINKNYKFYLTSEKIIKCLVSNGVENQVLDYIKKNYVDDLEGKVNYLRNCADSECMCLETKNNIYLIFYGTQFTLSDPVSCIKDLCTDLSLGLEPLYFLKNKTNVKIHSKYQENMLNQNLIKKISKIVYSSNFDKIIICGHSMGCGLALYTSLYLSKHISNKKYELMTLDAPKLGNSGLNKYLRKNKNIHHIDMINGNDMIPLYPFIYPNYQHICDKIILIGTNGKVKTTKKFSRNILESHSIKDHYCTSILKYIHQILTNY